MKEEREKGGDVVCWYKTQETVGVVRRGYLCKEKDARSRQKMKEGRLRKGG